MPLSGHVLWDYASTTLSLRAHPVSFVRPKLQRLNVVTIKELQALPDAAPVKVAGLVLVRQRPETAKGVCFITLEDESGVANLVVFATVFEQFRKVILQARLLMVDGKLQRQDEVLHIIVSACYDFSKLMRGLSSGQQENTTHNLNLPDGEEQDRKAKATEIDEKIFSKGRSFH
jgi:error-prone DNA polymerase